jgi:hypothetical protein
MIRSRARIVALIAGCLLLLGTAAVAAAPTVNVACSITSNVLSCPLPAPVTVTSSATKTVTSTLAPSTVTSTVTAGTTTAASTTSATSSTTTTAAPPPGGWPDATNTGTPAGVTLHDCPSTITVAGNYDACHFTGGVRIISVPGVTITRSLINGQVTGVGDTLWGAVISDTTIDCGCKSVGANDTPFAIEDTNNTLTRVNILNMGGGASAGSNVTIQDSWIHGEGGATEAHKGGIYGGGGTNTVIRHNNVECDDGALGCTDAIGLLDDFGDSTYYTIDNNLLNARGAACFYGSGSAAKPFSSNHVTFTNNHFGRKFYPDCALYGPVSFWDVNAAGNVWTGNVWDDTGAIVPPLY